MIELIRAFVECYDTLLAMNELEIWIDLYMSVAILFTVATLTVYSVAPEVKNLRGSLIRGYLSSYLAQCVLWLLLFVYLFNSSDSLTYYVEYFYVVGRTYFSAASLLWIHVMSFDVCQNFREIPSSLDVTQRISDETRLVRYSIYAWGSPVVYTVIFSLPIFNKEQFHFCVDEISTVQKIFDIAIISCVAISSTCFYILTSTTIRNRRREIAQLVDGVTGHREQDEQWFNLYVKLFIIVGVRMILLEIVELSKYRFAIGFFVATEAAKSVLVFLLLVWVNDVKVSFRKPFNWMMRKLGSILPFCSTSTIENKNAIENL